MLSFSIRARIPQYLHSSSSGSALLFSKPVLYRLPSRNMSPSAPVRMIQTAACLVIGDEVLNGKIVDTNSPFFAKYCFSLGLDLKRVEVIPDDEADIIEAVRRMSEKYDFVVTSGGIGPTYVMTHAPKLKLTGPIGYVCPHTYVSIHVCIYTHIYLLECIYI
ncbi:hypothetical protein TWF751_002593, partial [Orbilia oligospora]